MFRHFLKLKKPKKSAVFNTYWRFANERQNTFYRRLENTTGPWTEDPIIRNYRFTNVFRASDRVSQFLIKIQNIENQEKEDIFFRTLLFKIFNKIETFLYLERELKAVTYSSFNFEKYDKALTKRLAENKTIYSAAYIMPSAGTTFGFKFKHTNHLALLDKIMKEELYLKILNCKSLEECYKLLLSYPSFGKFLAFQYTIDLNYSSILDFSEMDFVVAGPGARNGILKCFDDLGDYSFEDIIRLMADNQEADCETLGLSTPTLWGRRLQLIDCQNLFCEVDKYLRVSNPEISAKTGKVRIKQKYKNTKGTIDLFFPPKWNINLNKEETCQKKAKDAIFL